MLNQGISGKTKICGIIGDPVEHTLSPAMHNAAFKELSLDYIYIPFRVRKTDLSKAIYGIKALNIRGLNVTIPHKIAVTAMLDELDPVAIKIGAVNTIVNNDGILKGYNTDAAGFIRAFTERGIELKDKNILVLGAGGASRAVCFALAEKKAEITILNRTAERAQELAMDISNSSKRIVTAGELNIKNLEKYIKKADILVNTTSLGMGMDSGDTPVISSLLHRNLIVYDIVYNPLQTRLLLEAEKTGATVISGMEMLLWQGANSFEIWTGVRAPVEIMRRKLMAILQTNED